MKKIIQLLVAVLLSGHSAISYAQLTFPGSAGGRGAVLMSSSGYGVDIENSSDSPSPPFTVRAWASTDTTFQDSEVISVTDYEPLAAGETIRSGYRYSIPLDGDTRPLSEIVGSIINFQVCIEVVGATPVCRLRGDSVISPDPPNFEASSGTSQDGVELTFTVPTVNSEIPFEFLKVTRTDRILDQGPIAPAVEITIPASEVEMVEDFGNQISLKVLVETADSSPAQFTLQQCYSVVVGAFQCGASGLVSEELGYRQEVAQSVGGEFNDRIRVQWPRFVNSEFFNAYEVTRCEANDLSACNTTLLRSAGAIETYDDFSVLRGQEYIYSVDACEGMNPNTCVVGENVNIARSGKTFVGLVDEFETDDSAGQASTVNSTVSQLRSFHTVTDDDWVRVEIAQDVNFSVSTSAFDSQNVDTILELYSGSSNNLELLEDNDDSGQTASFSQIGPMTLSAGTYFLKATHFKLVPDGGGDPIIPAPIISNYRLNFAIESLAPVTMAPVIDLLLSD